MIVVRDLIIAVTATVLAIGTIAGRSQPVCATPATRGSIATRRYAVLASTDHHAHIVTVARDTRIAVRTAAVN